MENNLIYVTVFNQELTEVTFGTFTVLDIDPDLSSKIDEITQGLICFNFLKN